ncbi:uncharacterized protein LOC110987172 isoform X2 [Acanthaster planci]|uniref:Uncharacterized protein LOC110987172 isoform X2 n=1 Tax=Acanthaster planci TaxID=133434 RepID=A0A8B7ZPL2_ACAPL|nr:uncharacterized protein LOC110987172 isoform X2 [Acanthaster planci]
MARQRSGGNFPTQGIPTPVGVGKEAADIVREHSLFELALLTRLRTPDTKVGARGRSYVSQNRVFYRLCSHVQRGCTSVTLLMCSNGYLLVRCDEPAKPPIMKQVLWFQNPQKEIQAIALDPSGRQAVCACRDSSIYLVPIYALLHPSTGAKQSWKADDLTRIIAPNKRGIPAQVVWWNSSDGRRIVIVGTREGEITLIDVAGRKVVRALNLKEEVAILDVVNHPGVTYLLIQSDPGNQWGLLLEKQKADANRKTAEIEIAVPGFEVIHPHNVPKLNILNAQESQSMFLPYCFNNFMDVVTLSTQSAMGQSFVAAHDYDSNIYKIFDSSIDNWFPLHVYRLPPQCSHVVLTDRLMFVIYIRDGDMVLGVLSSHLSETGNQDHPPNPAAVMQTFFLPSDERVVAVYKCSFPAGYVSDKTTTQADRAPARYSQQGVKHQAQTHTNKSTTKLELPSRIETHTVLEGCLLVTDVAVYQCRPRISPEGLFLELAMEEMDTSLPENLGITLALPMKGLYGLAANRKLAEGETGLARRLYHRSEWPMLKRVGNFVSQGFIQEALGLVLSALGEPRDLSGADKRQLADIAIRCFLYQMLEGRSDEALISRFRQFLMDNFDYNEISALETFAQYGMQDLIFEVARSRGLVGQALEALLTHGSPELDCEQQCLLVSQGFISTMASSGDNAFLVSMTTQEAVNRLVEKPELCYRYMELFSRFLGDLKLATLMKLAWLFDPSKPTIRPLLTRAVTTAKAKIQTSSSSASLETMSSDCEGSLESALDTTQSFPKPSALVEFFLRVLIVLNRKRIDQGNSSSLLNFDPSADSSSPSSDRVQQAVSLPPQRNILSCGQFHVAVVSGDDVYTWGKAHGGRLGHGDIIPADGRSAPFRVETLHMHQIRIISVACGKEHTMALGDQGRLYSWGTSKCGQLGLGDQTTRTRPSLVQALTGQCCVAIACGQYHSLALTKDQKVYSWGWGVHGQLGHSSVEDQLQPRHVTALDSVRVTQIAGGYCHSIVLSANGQVYVCGSGTFGQLGLGKVVMKRTTPTLLDGFSKERVVLVAGGLFHNIAVTANPQRVYIWGKSPLELRQSLQSTRKRKTSRDVSSDTVIVGRRRSVTVMESRPEDENQYLRPYAFDCGKICAPIKEIACSMNHNLILTCGGQLFSFGKNDSGQLGLGHRTEQRIPVLLRVCDEHCIAAIGAGTEFSVAITAQGQVFSWGSPENGQLGIDASHRNNPQLRQPRLSKSAPMTRLVVTPMLVPGIPRVALSSAVGMTEEEESDEEDMESSDEEELEEVSGWDLPSLGGADPAQPPYGLQSLSLALTSLEGRYDRRTVLQLCQDWRLWQAAAEVCELDRNYPLALLYQLKEREGMGVELRGSQGEEEGLREVTALVDKFIRLTFDKSTDVTLSDEDIKESCKLLLIQVLQFWAEQELPQEVLESLLRKHMDNVAYPLSVLLLCDSLESSPSAGMSGSCLVPPNLIQRFTSKFCLEVTSAVVQHVSQGKPSEDFRPAGGAVDETKARNSTLTTLTAVSSKGGVYRPPGGTGRVAVERLWEEVLHNLGKDAQARAHVSISKSEAAGLVDSSPAREGPENSAAKSDCVVFTCGHHYRKGNLQESATALWISKMATLPVPLPSNTQSLGNLYAKGDGFLPMACPDCVHSSLKLQQQIASDGTST